MSCGGDHDKYGDVIMRRRLLQVVMCRSNYTISDLHAEQIISIFKQLDIGH